MELKKKYDDSFEGGKWIGAPLPLDSSLSHYRFKKVMVVSARDMIVIGKGYRPNKDDLYLFGKSCVVPSYPEVKGYVRADTLNSGWRIKEIEHEVEGVKKAVCKVWFYSEVDFKISLFL